MQFSEQSCTMLVLIFLRLAVRMLTTVERSYYTKGSNRHALKVVKADCTRTSIRFLEPISLQPPRPDSV